MVGAWGRALQRNRKTGLQLRLAFSCCVTLCQLLNLSFPRASLVAQRLKSLPAMRETWVQSLGQEDTLEKGMATHSSILAWGISWTEKPGGLQSMRSHRAGHD